MKNKILLLALLALIVVCLQLPQHTIADNTTVSPQVTVVLDVPYGSESESVGKIDLGDPALGSGPPMCPQMFQMTNDGMLWVLDTVNSRVLAFKDGKQVDEVSTSEIKRWPNLFGVTKTAIWIKKTTRHPGTTSRFSLLRYDRADKKWRDVVLQLPDGLQLDPLRISTKGLNDTSLLLFGSLDYGAKSRSLDTPESTYASIVINDDGKITRVDKGDIVLPSADDDAWVLSVDDNPKPTIPYTLKKYDPKAQTWNSILEDALPRRPELSGARKEAIVHPIALDSQLRIALVVSEGIPLSQRFMRISITGNVLSATTLEDLGWESGPLSMYPTTANYQLLPDGSILAHYANKDRYRIIRITF